MRCEFCYEFDFSNFIMAFHLIYNPLLTMLYFSNIIIASLFSTSVFNLVPCSGLDKADNLKSGELVYHGRYF